VYFIGIDEYSVAGAQVLPFLSKQNSACALRNDHPMLMPMLRKPAR
jgi:hypothetical protein